ncbi:Structural maintenance of chromosomes protein 1 [Kappamyces sp. JEL0680]|nr:Structural maintenance of chromosomes protein 1 [Kappamyces sp. JEL0680]
MDAISFVLGVKSWHLRSEKLRELIYYNTGTQPSEASDDLPVSCSVELEYVKKNKTMLFKRAVLESGASEYRIDGRARPFPLTVVTFSRYSEVLAAENILIKARNFLVFQGDVETVASQSPKDLTLLIEQISGFAAPANLMPSRSLELKPEYDRLKAELEKATEASALNFNKKRSMNAEVKQFKEQQNEAERYEKLKVRQVRSAAAYAEVKLIQIQHLWKLYHLEKQLKSLQDAVDADKESLSGSTSKQKELADDLKDAKRQYAKISKQVLQLERNFKDKEREKLDLKPELFQAEEALLHIEKKIAAGQENLEDATKLHASQTKALKGLERDLKLVETRISSHEGRPAQTHRLESLKQSRSGINLSSEDLQTYNKLREVVATRTFAEKTRFKSIKQQLGSIKDTANRYQSTIDSQRERSDELEEERSAAESKKKSIEAKISSTTEALGQAKSKMRELQGEQKRLHMLEVEANEKLTEIVNRLLQARVDKNESEKTQRFKETLETLKRLFPGILGKVADLCKPTQRKYDLAVSVIMGKNMDSIVVDTEKTAIECIKYMRDQRAGQATFLPLDTIAVKPTQEKYRSFVKGARLAIDVIQFDSSVDRAIRYVVGNALIGDNIDIARHIVYDKNQEVKVVTLDGTVLHKTGMITGGHSDNTSGHAQRWEEKEVEDLTKRRDALTAQLDDIIKRQRRASQDEHLLSEITGLEARLTALRDDLSAATQKIESVDTELEHIQTEGKDVKSDYQQTTASIRKLEGEMDQLDQAIQKVEQQVFADFCRKIRLGNIREYERSTLKATQEAAEARLELSTTKAKLENL